MWIIIIIAGLCFSTFGAAYLAFSSFLPENKIKDITKQIGSDYTLGDLLREVRKKTKIAMYFIGFGFLLQVIGTILVNI